MYGDTSVIRDLARDLRERAVDIRSAADALVGQAERTRWTGLAADAMRAHCRDRAAALRVTATRHEDAADALERHAAAVDRVKELVAAIERRVRALVDGARDRLAGLAGSLHLPDPFDLALDRFDPPPPGSLAWLDVDLPGLPR
jgi:hypothetical protein